MKKSLLRFMLGIAVVAVLGADLEAVSTPQAAPTGQPAAQPGTAAQPQKKEIKDPSEYNAYVGAVQQTDPNAKAAALESFLQQYPNSVMKEDALELLMANYQQSGNAAKMSDAATRLLQTNPNNVRALALLAFTKRTAGEAGQNAMQNLADARQVSERGLQALQSMAKPEGVSDADFQKLKTQTRAIFNGAIGMAALQQKDYPTAQQHLRAAVEINPNNLSDVYPLALSYLTANPPDDVNGLWFMARAVNLAQGTPAQAQITDFATRRYRKFHGSDQGWPELVSQARTSPLPPAGFTIAAAPPPPSPAQQAQDIVNSKEVKDMSFGEWELILTSGNQAAADKVWTAINGKPIALQAQLISATPTKLTLAATTDAIDQKRADVELTMVTTIPARLMPRVGSQVQFQGTPVGFDPQPFVMRMTKGALLTKATPAKKSAAKSKTTAHRRRQ